MMKWIINTLFLATMGMGLSFGLAACDDGGDGGGGLDAQAVCTRMADAMRGIFQRCEVPAEFLPERSELIADCAEDADPEARVSASLVSKCEKDMKAMSCEELFSEEGESPQSCEELDNAFVK